MRLRVFFLLVCFFWPCLLVSSLFGCCEKNGGTSEESYLLCSFFIAWFRVSVDPKLKLPSLVSSVPQDLDLLFFFFFF